MGFGIVDTLMVLGAVPVLLGGLYYYSGVSGPREIRLPQHRARANLIDGNHIQMERRLLLEKEPFAEILPDRSDISRSSQRATSSSSSQPPRNQNSKEERGSDSEASSEADKQLNSWPPNWGTRFFQGVKRGVEEEEQPGGFLRNRAKERQHLHKLVKTLPLGVKTLPLGITKN